jgi:hypothetical protein
MNLQVQIHELLKFNKRSATSETEKQRNINRQKPRPTASNPFHIHQYNCQSFIVFACCGM